MWLAMALTRGPTTASSAGFARAYLSVSLLPWQPALVNARPSAFSSYGSALAAKPRGASGNTAPSGGSTTFRLPL
jgi:hypothetical protein